MKKTDFLGSLAMCLVTAVLSLAVASAFVLNYVGGREGLAFLSKINVAREIIEERYVGEYDPEGLADSAVSGMVDSLDDPWSYYMTAEHYSVYVDRVANSSNGIGVTIYPDAEGRGFAVSDVVANSPAERAGIGPGCVITAVAGQSVAGMSVSDISALVKSQAGEYSIDFLDVDGIARSSVIKNEYIYRSPVSYSMLDGNVGYVRLNDFYSGAAADGIAAVDELLGNGAGALIFDVRDNPGGQLDELTELLDHLLPEGEIFISSTAEGEERIYYSEAGNVDVPMAVLINSNSISAAEFFAAALQEFEKAVLVGEASTGKSRAQSTFVLDDGSAVHISTISYRTPGGRDLAAEGGLTPDIAVELEGESDSQLEKALEYLS